MKHLKYFETVAEYEAATLEKPFVAYAKDSNESIVNPLDPQKVICTYNCQTADTDIFLAHDLTNCTDVLLNGVSIKDDLSHDEDGNDYYYYFDTTGNHEITFIVTGLISISDIDAEAIDLIAVRFENYRLENLPLFIYATSLTSMTIPSSVTSLKDVITESGTFGGVLKGTTALTSVTFEEDSQIIRFYDIELEHKTYIIWNGNIDSWMNIQKSMYTWGIWPCPTVTVKTTSGCYEAKSPYTSWNQCQCP